MSESVAETLGTVVAISLFAGVATADYSWYFDDGGIPYAWGTSGGACRFWERMYPAAPTGDCVGNDFCAGIGGYFGDDPCAPTATRRSTWGGIKATFK